MDRPSLTAYCKKFAALIAGLIIGQHATADFSFQSYRNRNSPNFTFLDSAREEASVTDNPLLNSATYQYFHHPLAYDQQEDGSGSLVPGVHSFNIAGEYSASLRTSVGLELPAHQLNFGSQGDSFALGDLRAFSKIRLSPGFALIPSVYVPTGNRSVLLSNPNGGAGLTLAAERKLGRVIANINAGADYFPGASYAGVDYALQPFGGAGISYPFSDRWSLQLEGVGRMMDRTLMGDVYLGGRVKAGQDRSFTFGGSLASAEGDPMYRLMLGWMWSPGRTKVVHMRTKVETVQKIKTVLDCGPKPFTKQIRGRALSEREKQAFLSRKSLPYAVQLLSPGVKTEAGAGDLSVVRDGEVLFAFDLVGLPAQDSVIAVKDLDLLITVNKLWRPGGEKTDMICLIEEKICSGDLNQKNLGSKINSEFFKGKEPPNDYFVRQILQTAPPQGKSVTKARLKLPLEKLIENSTFTNTLALIYPVKTLYFAVASDVYVQRDVRLSVNMNVQVCTEDKPKPTTEIIEQKSKVLEEVPVNE